MIDTDILLILLGLIICGAVAIIIYFIAKYTNIPTNISATIQFALFGLIFILIGIFDIINGDSIFWSIGTIIIGLFLFYMAYCSYKDK